MATSPPNDVCSYCTKRRSPVYTCSLDVELAQSHSHWIAEYDSSSGKIYLRPSAHVNDRIAAFRRAESAIQGTGFCNVTTNANIFGYLWESAIRPVLLHGSISVFNNF